MNLCSVSEGSASPATDNGDGREGKERPGE